MTFDVVTLFPGMFVGPLDEGILARARRDRRVGIRIHDLRGWGVGRHRQVDDTPYGGGGGMVLKPEPLVEAVETIRAEHPADREKVVLLSPQGRRLDTRVSRDLAGLERVILLCGRYEGVDERVRELVVDEELSIGDFVVTGGELPAMVVIDAVSRLVPGVLGRPGAAEEDSFFEGVLDFPQYTRPSRYRDASVPDVLLQGDHGAIRRWRQDRAREVTRSKRPDLPGAGAAGDARAEDETRGS